MPLQDRPPWQARIRSSRTIDALGGGVLCTPYHIATCAHVIASEWPAATLYVDFQFSARHEPIAAEVLVSAWTPATAEGFGDVAILTLLGPTPPDAWPAPLHYAESIRGHRFRTYGYPKGHTSDGVWSEGSIRGFVKASWLQLQADAGGGFPLDKGFSGSAIWDDDLEAVIGIVVGKDLMESARTGYGLPVQVLERYWPGLQKAVELSHKSREHQKGGRSKGSKRSTQDETVVRLRVPRSAAEEVLMRLISEGKRLAATPAFHSEQDWEHASAESLGWYGRSLAFLGCAYSTMDPFSGFTRFNDGEVRPYHSSHVAMMGMFHGYEDYVKQEAQRELRRRYTTFLQGVNERAGYLGLMYEQLRLVPFDPELVPRTGTNPRAIDQLARAVIEGERLTTLHHPRTGKEWEERLEELLAWNATSLAALADLRISPQGFMRYPSTFECLDDRPIRRQAPERRSGEYVVHLRLCHALFLHDINERIDYLILIRGIADAAKDGE